MVIKDTTKKFDSIFEGADGFKLVGSKRRLEATMPMRTQELFNALDLFDEGELLDYW